MNMQKLILTLAASIVAASVYAQAIKPVLQGVSDKPAAVGKQMSPELRAKLLARTGGFVKKGEEGPAFVFLNLQDIIPEASISVAEQQILGLFQIGSEVKSKSGSKDIMKEAVSELKNPKTGAVIVICNAPEYPSILVAPESRWAMVNVAALSADKPAKEVLAVRTTKELWRAFGYLMGAANSNTDGCVMQTVQSSKDLDDMTAQSMSAEPLGKIAAHMEKLGFIRSRMTTYRKACEEGWAPAPTNDVQKAIWAELKAGKKQE